MLSVLNNIANLFVHFHVCTIKTYNFIYIILWYVFLHLHTIPMYVSIIFHSRSMIFMCANFWHLCTTSSVLDKCIRVCMVGIFHSYSSVIHDLRVFDLPFISPFVYIDNWDFLRENGEVDLVLGIRERP